ncbi:MAG: hypothetical protein NTY02_19480 [Acidobacteria bacterium]|nr:hypothetical protein [Acidobacteriota bacterium]
MTPQPDATIVLLGIAALVGWGAGFALAVCLFWRRIRGHACVSEEWRRVRACRDDAA